MKRETKSLRMDPEAFKRLQKRARQLDMPLGLFVENMLGSLEFRLERAFKMAGVHPYESEYVFPLVTVMWADDKLGLGHDHFVKSCQEIGAAAVRDEDSWEPRISLGGDQRPMTGEETQDLLKKLDQDKK